jgi:AcrR family transcriptional regulator
MDDKRSPRSIPADAEQAPRPSLRDEQKRVTYERLLNAAKELFETTDAADVTIDQIARRAGTNRTTFYLHFEDKSHIAFKIRIRYMPGEIENILHYLGDPDGITHDGIKRWIRNRTTRVRKLRTVIQLGTEIMNRKPELMLEFISQIAHVLDTGFAAHLDRLDADTRERVRAEMQLAALTLNRYLYITVVQDLAFPSKQGFEALIELWYRILTTRS